MSALEGEDNRLYLENLEQSLRVLATQTSADQTLDQSVYSKISPQVQQLASTIRLLRWLDSEEDYHKNSGIYKSTHIGGNGFPDYREYTKLLSDQRYAEEHLKSIKPLDAILASFRELLFCKGEAKAETSASSSSENCLLTEIDMEYRKWKFYNEIGKAHLFSLASCNENMQIIPLESTKNTRERYQLVFPTLDKIRNIWAVNLCDVEEENIVQKKLLRSPISKDQIYIDAKGKHISEDLVNLLDLNAGFGAAYLMMSLDMAEGIYPQSISTFNIGAFYSPQLPGLSARLQQVFESYPGSFVLLARRDCIESQGEHELAGLIRQIYSQDQMKHDEFLVFPSELKQHEGTLIEMDRMKQGTHIYEA